MSSSRFKSWSRSQFVQGGVIGIVVVAVLSFEPDGHSFWQSLLWCIGVGLLVGTVAGVSIVVYRRLKSGSWKGVRSHRSPRHR